jgi:hypothetical protein
MLRAVVWCAGVPIIVWLVVRAARTAARIRALHARLLEEEEASPKDPWTRQAELEAERDASKR